MATLRADVVQVAGDSFPLVVTGSGMAGGFVRCTVKRYLDDPDSAALAEADSVDGGAVIDSDTQATVTFAPAVTELWPSGLLWYDVQLVSASGAIKTLVFGAIKALRRITLTRTEPSAHLPLSADVAALVLSGGDAALSHGYGLTADVGALVLAGADVALTHSYTLAAGVGALTLTGANATLTRSAPLDALESPPVALYSIVQRLLSSYTGPLIRVRRTTGGDTATEHDVPYVPATGLLDAADLAAFVGSESWAIVTVYDQSGNGLHITQATVASQPTGGTAGVGELIGTQPAAKLDGNDYWERAGALGLSGATALSAWVDCTIAAGNTVQLAIGQAGGGKMFYINAPPTPTTLTVNLYGSSRTFTSANYGVGRQRLIARLGAGAGIGTAQLMQNGAELPELSAVDPGTALDLGTTSTIIGSWFGSSRHRGNISQVAFFDADLSAHDLAIINGLP